MSAYFREKYKSDKEFKDKYKEKRLDQYAATQKLKESKISMFERNSLMERMKRFQQYHKMWNKTDKDAKPDPMQKVKLSEYEQLKEARVRRDKTVLWQQYVHRALYSDLARSVRRRELTNDVARQLNAKAKKLVAKALENKDIITQHMYFSIKRLLKHVEAAEKIVEGVADPQVKEDLLSSSYGGIKVHVFSQEAYGTDRTQYTYQELEDLLEKIKHGFADDSNFDEEENELDQPQPDQPETVHVAQTTYSVNVTEICDEDIDEERVNVVLLDNDEQGDSENDPECFKLLNKFVQDKYSGLFNEFYDILNAVESVEKFLAQEEPPTTTSLKKLEKRVCYFKEHCMQALEHLDGIVYDGDNKLTQLHLRRKRKIMVDSVQRLIEDVEGLNARLKEVMGTNGEDKSSHLLSPDISIVDTDPSEKVVSLYFNPVDSSWQLTRASLLGLSVSSANSMRSDVTESRLIHTKSPPIDQQEISPDGNCLFRAMSYVIVGNEDSHQAIRQQVVSFMNENWRQFADMEGWDKSKFDAQMAEMAQNSTWGTWLEILALATLLQTTIYTYIRSEGRELAWVKYAPLFPLDYLPPSDRFIMLDNHAQHYEPVFDVQNVDSRPNDVLNDSVNGGYVDLSESKAAETDVPRYITGSTENADILTEQNIDDNVIDLDAQLPNETEAKTMSGAANKEEQKEPEAEKPALGRLCECPLPELWATRLHAAFAPLTNLDLPVMEMQQRILDFEDCNECSPYGYPTCRLYDDGGCKDNLKFLRNMSPHFRRLRTIQRIFYEIRHCNLWLIELDSLLGYGSYKSLEHHIEVDMPLIPKPQETTDEDIQRPKHTQQEVREKYGRFEKDKATLPTHECKVCHIMKFKSETRLLEPRDPKVIELLEQPGSALNVLMERDGLQLPLIICKGGSKYDCYGPLMKNSAPLLSSLNNMGLGDVPPELSCLNDFEKVLIQRAKCFMTIVKLKPYRYRGPQNTLTKAKKGTAVHFDLPTERTVQYVAETLPSTQFVEVMVDTIPTRSNIVWRSVVDMDKVVHALEYLRSHGNELYSNIKIDYHALDVDDEEPIPESSDEGEEILDSPNLQHMTEEEAKNQCDHYTVKALAHEFAKTDEIDQFLENYKFRRVQGDPVKEYDEKGKQLEAQCFPCLFPDGAGYFADQRNIPVPFRQYARSRLQNKDSRFRKDYQYLFYLLHHKEMKMIDQGVFATFRTGNAQDMTVGDLQDRLSAKDKLLEANMNNLLTLFRGSEQFWNRKSSDLAAMDREFGPATFFLTLSCKEYEWEELRVYLEAIDTDLAGQPLSYLCAKNLVAVSIYFEHRFRRFFNGVILDKNGPLGEIEHWVWRLEYQSRGAPHTHIKLWAKNAPILGEENVTEEMVTAYIDKHITCRRPDPVTEYDLYKMVTENQTHRCTDSCLVKKENVDHHSAGMAFHDQHRTK